MQDKLFKQLMDSVRWAKDHMAGKPVEVGRVSVIETVGVKRGRIETNACADAVERKQPVVPRTVASE